MVNGRKIGEGVYVIVLVIFTVYMLLDTFVILRSLLLSRINPGQLAARLIVQ